MNLIIVLLIGVVIGMLVSRFVFREKSVGSLLSRFIFKEKPVGSLRVDESDPDSGPYLFLELDRSGADAIYKQRYVRLRVELKNYISHKYKGLFHTARQVFKNRPRSPVNRLYSFYCAKENRKLIP